MSGKRLLDAVALFNASRKVATKHFEIRRSQFELYAKTSSVLKAIRNQVPPAFTLAAQNLIRSISKTPQQNHQDESIPSEKSTPSSDPTTNEQEPGIRQDHFYEKSQQNSTADPPPHGELDISQEQSKTTPLPDGTIPPENSKIQARTSEDAKRLQRQFKYQIPSKVAEPPSADASGVMKERHPELEDFGVEQEKDIFYQPPNAISPVLSALPRVRVPKIENDVQGGDTHIPKDLNADVYYSGTMKESATEPSEEQLAQIFQSPRIARLLSRKDKNIPKGVTARQFHSSNQRLQRGANTETESIKNLAADMAKDAKSNQEDLTSPQYRMRESKVPSSRLNRLFEYGGLAASMAFGAVSDKMSQPASANSSFMLSPSNIERLVAKLSKMRGAALKLGQMISFQDSKMLPKPVHDVLQRVQDSADYMPASQRNTVIEADLGPDWRGLFQSFEEKPIAAASIGQVHGAVLKDGRHVAVKVQYPGVADSISSDLNNLSLLLTASRLLPKGLYLDKTIANARVELAWECDYIREAEGAKRFKKLVADEKHIFTVPNIFEQASGKQVLTMERMEGVAVTKVQNFTQEQKDWIGTQILRLCLREIVEFKYMQTDPNWTNFLYNKNSNKIELLDFGAAREYPDKFIMLYVKLLEAASRMDRKACEDLSIQLGYLTGYESKTMVNAHVDSILTLAEPFMDVAPDVYNFEDQTITDRVRGLIPIMLRERLAPPPEETYSLHRKLSGAFLLCARLGSRVRCKEMFRQALLKADLR